MAADEVIEALRTAISTAANDDCSKAMGAARARHCQRVEAMHAAITWIEEHKDEE